ncbi:restriction endonuclease [Amycolatopsis sp. cmx-11-51]|uniref:restriction endonuclease n=1 Tax=Amycolatopsis sp. cmx-11-51 TaxID=2785797 RepID=UPI0039E5CA8E
MTALVAAILHAKEFTCDVAPPGPDGGIDILAGTGALGLDTPGSSSRSKSETTYMGRPVVQQLHGAFPGRKPTKACLSRGVVSLDLSRRVERKSVSAQALECRRRVGSRLPVLRATARWYLGGYLMLAVSSWRQICATGAKLRSCLGADRLERFTIFGDKPE